MAIISIVVPNRRFSSSWLPANPKTSLQTFGIWLAQISFRLLTVQSNLATVVKISCKPFKYLHQVGAKNSPKHSVPSWKVVEKHCILLLIPLYEVKQRPFWIRFHISLYQLWIRFVYKNHDNYTRHSQSLKTSCSHKTHMRIPECYNKQILHTFSSSNTSWILSFAWSLINNLEHWIVSF